MYVDDLAGLVLVHRAMAANQPEYLAWDIETTGLNEFEEGAKVVTVQVAWTNAETHTGAAVLDARRLNRGKLLGFLEYWMKHPATHIIHNAPFDLAWLAYHYRTPIPEKIFCTMTVERVLTAGLDLESSSLKDTIQRRLKQDISKAEQKNFLTVGDRDLTEDEIRYAEMDVLLLWHLMKAQRQEIARQHLGKTVQLEMAVLPVAIRAHLFGVAVDPVRWRTHIEHLQAKAAALAEPLTAIFQPYVDEWRAQQAKDSPHKFVYAAEYEEAAGLWEAAFNRVYDESVDEFAATRRAPWRLEYETVQQTQGRKAAAEWRKENPDPGEGRGWAREVQRLWRTDHPKPEFIGGPMNLNSDQQMGGALTLMGVPLPTTDKGNPSVSGKALIKLKDDFPVVEQLVEFMTLSKLVESFGESVLRFVDNQLRLHPVFNTMGAKATGRFSCTKPNVQQIPNNEQGKELRSCFIAPRGRRLVSADYSGQELRLLCFYSQEPGFLWAFKNGVDLHSMTAFQTFAEVREGLGVSLDQMNDMMAQADKNPDVLDAIKKILKRVKTEYERYRHYAKTVNFGIPYGRTKYGMAKGLNMTPDEAQAIIDTYFAANTNIKEWLDKTARMGMVRWYVQTSIGRKRFFEPLKPGSYEYRRWSNSYRRAMGNMPIQGGGADITKLAMVRIDKRLRAEGRDAFIVMTIHDEIVCEVAEDEAEAVLRIMVEEMVAAGDYVLQGQVPVEVDAKISTTWEH